MKSLLVFVIQIWHRPLVHNHPCLSVSSREKNHNYRSKQIRIFSNRPPPSEQNGTSRRYLTGRRPRGVYVSRAGRGEDADAWPDEPPPEKRWPRHMGRGGESSPAPRVSRWRVECRGRASKDGVPATVGVPVSDRRLAADTAQRVRHGSSVVVRLAESGPYGKAYSSGIRTETAKRGDIVAIRSVLSSQVPEWQRYPYV